MSINTFMGFFREEYLPPLVSEHRRALEIETNQLAKEVFKEPWSRWLTASFTHDAIQVGVRQALLDPSWWSQRRPACSSLVLVAKIADVLKARGWPADLGSIHRIVEIRPAAFRPILHRWGPTVLNKGPDSMHREAVRAGTALVAGAWQTGTYDRLTPSELADAVQVAAVEIFGGSLSPRTVDNLMPRIIRPLVRETAPDMLRAPDTRSVFVTTQRPDDAVSRGIANKMSDFPEIYVAGASGANVLHFLRDVLTPKERKGLRVALITHESFKAGAGGHSVRLQPAASLIPNDEWICHAVPFDDRVYDFDYNERPGDPVANYLQKQFPKSRPKAVIIPADVYVRAFAASRSTLSLLADAKKLGWQEGYLDELMPHNMEIRRIRNLPTRESQAHALGYSRNFQVTDGHVTHVYEVRNHFDVEHYEDVVSSVLGRRYAHHPHPDPVKSTHQPVFFWGEISGLSLQIDWHASDDPHVNHARPFAHRLYPTVVKPLSGTGFRGSVTVQHFHHGKPHMDPMAVAHFSSGRGRRA